MNASGRKAALSLMLFVSMLLSPGGMKAFSQDDDPAKARKPDAPAKRFGLDNFNDPLVPLDPIKSRSIADEDRLDASAWFMTGKLRESRNDFKGAYEAYRKAVGLDPKAVAIYRVLVPLAFSLNQTEEAVKYALQAVELDPDDYQLLRRLGVHMATQRRIPEAVQLLKKASESSNLKKDSGIYVILMRDLGILYGAIGEKQKAADSYAIVFDALTHPDKYKVDPRIRRQILAEPGATYERMGQTFLDADRTDLALKAFELASEARRGKPGSLSYNLARVYLKTKKAEQARAELQKYFDAQLQSKGSAAYQLLVEILTALGKSDELIGELETLAEKDSRNHALQYFLAEQYVEKKRLKEAEELYRKTLKVAGNADGYIGLARIYRLQERAPELIEALNKGLAGLLDRLLVAQITGAPDEAGLKLYEAQTKPIRENKKLLDAVLAAGAKLSEGDQPKLEFAGSYLLGKMALEEKKTDEAIRFFRFAIKTKRDPRVVGLYEELGQYLLFEVRKYPEAAKTYQDAVKDPALRGPSPILLYRLSLALEFDGQTDKALEAVEQGRKLADVSLFHFQKGWVYYHAQQWEKAIPLFEAVIEKFSVDNPQDKAMIRRAQFSLSAIYVQQGDIGKGEAVLEKVFAEEPDDPSVNNDLGYLYADQGKKLKQAESMIRKAIKAEPENAAYLDSMGWVLYRLGKFDEAATFLEKSTKSSTGGDATIWDHLGDCYKSLDNPDEAKEAWTKALKSAREDSKPDEKLIKKIEAKLDGKR